MRPPNARKIADVLSVHFGLCFEGSTNQDASGHPAIDLRPKVDYPNEAFTIRVTLGWRSLSAQLLPGSFAGSFVQDMGATSAENRDLFSELVDRCTEERGHVSMLINDSPVEPNNPGSWPSEWHRISLSLEKSPLAVNTEDEIESEQEVLHWSRRFTGMVLALAPLEEIEPSLDGNPEGLPEGACVREEVNRYERSPLNRAACIEVHGTKCKACSFDFGLSYGELGAGFIHVHHITPISKLGDGYIVQPARDLVPLCPNCHAMVHKVSPPLDINELRQRIAIARRNRSDQT